MLSRVMTDEDLANYLRARGWGGNSIPLGIKQDFRCVYCGRDLLQSIAAYDCWTVDHIDPTVRGPERDAQENTAVACKLCNFIKRAYNPKGDTKAERLDSAKGRVTEGRQRKQAVLDALVQAVTAWRQNRG